MKHDDVRIKSMICNFIIDAIRIYCFRMNKIAKQTAQKLITYYQR